VPLRPVGSFPASVPGPTFRRAYLRIGNLGQVPGDSGETILPTVRALLLGLTLGVVPSQLTKSRVQRYFGDLQCCARVTGSGRQPFTGPLLLQPQPKRLAVVIPTRRELFAKGKQEPRVERDTRRTQRRDY
jgi:hypothetical protein